MENTKKYAAEGVGTLLLVFFGLGSAIFGIDQIGPMGVALTFGFTLLALAYTFGPVSGCHINPAVTLGMLIARRISVTDAVAYWVAQFAGGIVGTALLWGMVKWGKAADRTGGLGTNDYGKHVNLGGALILEIVLTFLLVFVVLVVTSRTENAGFAGLAIGITLAVTNLAGIALDGASVNPARSLGPALFAGGTPLVHVWVFIVAPLIGGAIAAAALPLVVGEGWRYRSRVDAPPAGPTRRPARTR
jgi:aquaporin Z